MEFLQGFATNHIIIKTFGYHSLDVVSSKSIKKLKFLAVEEDKTLTDLFLEAIQGLLKKYEKKGKEQSAQL